MKRFVILFLAGLMCLASCQYDDSALWDSIRKNENSIRDAQERIVKLEQLCSQLNTNINGLQTIVNALQENDYVTSITPIRQGSVEVGYAISFSKSGVITIYHGKDGADGQDGKDGQDGAAGNDGAAGQDGHTPQIGVRQDIDGVYYWTLDGNWLLTDSGEKICAAGRDGEPGEPGHDGVDGQNGQDGADGQDGITPQLKIEDGWWFVSTDNGQEWTKLGRATGEDGADGQDGKPGQDGDSVFRDVVKESDGVKFILSNGTEFKVPLYSAALSKQIESIIYIPEYSDGIAEVTAVSGSEKGKVTLTFEVSPSSVLGQLDKDWRQVLKLQASKTRKRSISALGFIDMPILNYQSNAKEGTITITASGRNLSSDFYSGNEDAFAILRIADNAGTISSDKVSLTSKVSNPNPPTPPIGGDTEIITVKGVTFKMIRVAGGTFKMGATPEQGSDANGDEKPVHEVTLSDYWIGETEVTQELWEAVMGSNPSHGPIDPHLPVSWVSWNDIVNDFLPKLNELTGRTFSLPTEAQWEFAARGGNQTKGYKYSGSNKLDEVAWFCDNSAKHTQPVGKKLPNELGIYDMSGNVAEWCYDFYGTYSADSQTNPTGPVSGNAHVVRGGGHSFTSRNCRVSDRSFRYDSNGKATFFSFRLACRD